MEKGRDEQTHLGDGVLRMWTQRQYYSTAAHLPLDEQDRCNEDLHHSLY